MSLILSAYLSLIDILWRTKLCEVIWQVLEDLEEFLAVEAFFEQRKETFSEFRVF